MHVPDGYLDLPTSVATAGIAVAAVGLGLRGARRELDERSAPMAGLVAAFVFAAQMLNFVVGAGTSGHLLGGALAAVLVGPWTGLLCVSVVLIVQSLMFADGGITALGSNIVLISVVPVVIGWAVFRLARWVLPRRLAMVGPAAAVGAFVSVPVTAMVFSALYVVGGAAPINAGTLFATMLGWHLLIGVGEAVITALTVASIVAVRPDLVYGARPLLTRRELQIRNQPVGEPA